MRAGSDRESSDEEEDKEEEQAAPYIDEYVIPSLGMYLLLLLFQKPPEFVSRHAAEPILKDSHIHEIGRGFFCFPAIVPTSEMTLVCEGWPQPQQRAKKMQLLCAGRSGEQKSSRLRSTSSRQKQRAEKNRNLMRVMEKHARSR